MTGNFQKRFVTCGEEGRIGNLPEHLIESILERLPFQDAVRTSIISKNWRYRWTTMKALVFDEEFSAKFSKNGAFARNGFVRIINQVLILHKGPILKFRLHIPDKILDSFQEIDQWMIFLSRNGVRELMLTNMSRMYALPSHVFSCAELTHLKLRHCFFKPPLEFEGFVNLEELCLHFIDFGAHLTRFNLPHLKKLSLHKCINVYNFNIKATKLHRLDVAACPDATLLRLLESPSLIMLRIYLHQPIEGYVRAAERMNLATILSNLPRIKHLGIDCDFFKVYVTEYIPKWLPRAVNSLKRLGLPNLQLGDLHHLHGVLCLLRNSPNLEVVSIKYSKMDPRVDVGPALNHLEAPNCLDHTLDQLQTVFITSLEGSKVQVLFIKLLLAHSPSLKEFVIRPSGTCDAKKSFDIAKDVMRFPRASPKAEMIYLNPTP